MGTIHFIRRQLSQISEGRWPVLAGKIQRLLRVILKSPLFIFAIPIVLIIRLIKPMLLVRFGSLRSDRIGHFVANTELFLCEKAAGIDAPMQPSVDLFCLGGEVVCNQQLKKMWGRILPIWPVWMLTPLIGVNRLIPGGGVHEHHCFDHGGLDVHNLLDRSLPHLKFTPEEELRGEFGLRVIGIPVGSPFVCLNVRDSAYLAAQTSRYNWSYHSYRDSDVQNYVLAAEALAERGYFVIRMGSKVHAAINSSHPKVIDYATNGMRNDFMDIYLGAKCAFCITTGTGWDGVPEMMRRPIVYVNMVPLGRIHTFSEKFLSITKKHVWKTSQKKLNLREIFSYGIGFCMTTSGYESKGVDLIENSPDEIRDVAIEMAERLSGAWQTQAEDEKLQQGFWEIFPSTEVELRTGKPIHGKIRGRFGAVFLRTDSDWLLG